MFTGKVSGSHNGDFCLQLITDENSVIELDLKAEKKEDCMKLKGRFNVKNGNIKGECMVFNEERGE